MRIFLSHASEDRDSAEQIYLVLINAGHVVFFDRTVLQGGDDFNTRIRTEIDKCDLLIFLISPDSVAKSSYALTELKFAREKWHHPRDHVLPVMVRETNLDLVSRYLKAVSILEPEGNTAAEVGERVLGWKKRQRYARTRVFALILSGLLIGSLIALVIWYHRKDRDPSLAQTNYSSPPQNNDNDPQPSPSSAAANSARTDPAANLTPSTSKNIGRSQTQTPSQPTLSANNNQSAEVEPTPVTFPLTSRVLDGERPIKGAKISIVGEPEQGVVESNNNGLFTLKVAHKHLNDTVTLRVEYAGFVVWKRDITLGEGPPANINLERKK